MNPNGFNVSSQRSLSKIQAFTSLRQVIRHQNQVGMTKECNHHRPQTNPKLPEKKTQNTNTHMTTRTKLNENNQHSLPQQYACKAGHDTNCTSKNKSQIKYPYIQWKQMKQQQQKHHIETDNSSDNLRGGGVNIFYLFALDSYVNQEIDSRSQ